MKTFLLAVFVCVVAFAGQPAPIVVTAGAVGAQYTFTLWRANTVTGDVVFKASGRMPKGLTLSKDGTISGTPKESGTFVFTATISGGSLGSNRFQHDYRITIAAAPNPLDPGAFGGAPGVAVVPAPNPLDPAVAAAPVAAPAAVVVAPAPGSLPTPSVREPLHDGDTTFDVSIPAGWIVPAGPTISFTRNGAVDNLNDGTGPKASVPAVFAANMRMTLTPAQPIKYCDTVMVTLANAGAPSRDSGIAQVIPKPAIVQPPTSTKVTASLSWLPKTLTNVKLSVLVNGHPVYVKDGDNSVGAIAITKAQTDLTLAAPLQPGDLVVVRFQDSPCALTQDSDAVAFGNVPTTSFRDKLVPGQTPLWITVPYAPPGTGTLRIRVNNSIAGLSDGNGGTASAIQTTFPNLQALATLNLPLGAGDVATCEFQLGNTTTQCDPYTVIDPGDLGKIRYYFTSGIVLSNNQNFQVASTGTQAGLFLGLDVDRSWLSMQPHGLRRIGINSYFDARLTSVATQGVQTTGAVADTFLQSQKAASLQAGIYLPIMTNDWTPRDTPYAFSISPLAKTGFTTLTDLPANAPNQTQTGRFFTFNSYGTRLGIYKIHKDGSGAWDKNSSPESIGYFDVTMGRFGNFQGFRDLHDEYSSIPAMTQFQTIRPWRYSFEGLIKIPPVFVIGFNANIGRGAPAPVCVTAGTHTRVACSGVGVTTYPFLPPRDDLRFLFGAQFDIRQLLKKVPSF